MISAAKRHLWHVQQLSHDSTLDDDEFRTLTMPQVLQGQRACGLRFGDTAVLAVFTTLMMFRHLLQVFANSTLRHNVVRLLTRKT